MLLGTLWKSRRKRTHRSRSVTVIPSALKRVWVYTKIGECLGPIQRIHIALELGLLRVYHEMRHFCPIGGLVQIIDFMEFGFRLIVRPILRVFTDVSVCISILFGRTPSSKSFFSLTQIHNHLNAIFLQSSKQQLAFEAKFKLFASWRGFDNIVGTHIFSSPSHLQNAQMPRRSCG